MPLVLFLPRPPSTTLFPYTTLFRSPVAERHGAERHHVVDVLAARRIPHTTARRARHTRRQCPVRVGAEERVGSLATGRREAGNAPVAHRISPPRWPSPVPASPRADRVACDESRHAAFASHPRPDAS